MSEVKLNIVDAQQILHGEIHGSVADACIAALSAEPETIAELEAALARYQKPWRESGAFAAFRSDSEIDATPWDAGIVIIDLAARIAAAESTYSQPHSEGSVQYHDGTSATDIPSRYRVPDDWKFLNSIDEYEFWQATRRAERTANPPLDARTILYGQALFNFVASNIRTISIRCDITPRASGNEQLTDDEYEQQEALAKALSAIHARWLMTSRDDLRGQTPREVLLARQKFIDFDLHTRELEWSQRGEGPPCLPQDSPAYQFAGFGTQERVVYYDLVRHLLWDSHQTGNRSQTIAAEVARLEQVAALWLESPLSDYDGRVPANIVENERRRLPTALSAREMIVDDDCPTCIAMANDLTLGPGFWALDGSHMDDEFAFSHYATQEEWEAENRRREEFNKEFNRRWEERQQRIARGEQVDDEFNLDWIDSQDKSSAEFTPSDDEDQLRETVQ